MSTAEQMELDCEALTLAIENAIAAGASDAEVDAACDELARMTERTVAAWRVELGR